MSAPVLGDPPPIYASWVRSDYPDATDAKVARLWRAAGERDRRFWDAVVSDFAHSGRYRTALERLADEDTQVLDEGLGGGAQEELHVRTNLARQALGLDVCGCTECMVSLGLEPDDDSARDALDAQTLHDSPGSDL